MRGIVSTGVIIRALLVFLILCIPLSAQQKSTGNEPPHHRYKLLDLGTLGGPNSFYFSEPVVRSVNNRGTVVGGAETPAIDPLAPNCFPFTSDCQILHAFEWHEGRLTDLGTLPGGYNSVAYWINERGLVLGNAENGLIDPLTGIAEEVSVLWKDGQIINLGTLGGSFSFPNAMNERGQVVGVALNAIPDPLSFLGLGTQSRAFLWDDGEMRDLGTFGGPDGWAASINERGQVAGWALVDSTPNPVTGSPTQHPFLWQDGTLLDLGTLGGTLAVVGSLQSPGAGASLNNRGEVIGTSNLEGDLVHHPFRWQHGVMTDLGTLGGNNGEAWWINDRGDVVGRADFSPSSTDHHAFLWRQGVMTDLGVAAGQPCSSAIQINLKRQIIVDTGICGKGGGPGSLWEDGTLFDLNALVLPGSNIKVGDPSYINERGEIAATGLLPNGDKHAIVLIPCDQDHSNVDGCDYDPEDDTTAAGARAALAIKPAYEAATTSLPVEILSRYRSSMADRHRMFGAVPRN